MASPPRFRRLLLLLLLGPLLLATAVRGASVVGFDAAFTNPTTPFAVAECDAACTSPGFVTVQLQLVRAGDVSVATTVHVSTRPSSDDAVASGTAGDDYTALVNVPVVFAPHETTQRVLVTVVSDGVYEDDEFFEAEISSSSADTRVDTSAHVAYLKIVDGGDAGIFSFNASTYTFNEDAGLVQVTVVRTGGASGNVTVTYRLANLGLATAINTKSFQLTDAVYQLVFEENQREAFIPIRIINDAVYEVQEFFYLELSTLAPTKASDPTASVAKFGAARTAAVFIADDGDAGRFDFAAPYIFCREDNGSAVVSIVRSLGSSSSYTPVTLQVTTVGTNGGSNATEGGSLAFDYLATSDQLQWMDGETRKVFPVKIFNNERYEPVTRAFKIVMAAVDGGARIGTQRDIWVYIVDDRDAGTLSFEKAQYEVLENASNITVQIMRSGLFDASGVNTYTSGIVSVDVSTYAGTILPGKQKYDDDYDNGVVEALRCTHVSPCTALAGVAYTPLTTTTITFADGENNKTVTIPILDDTLFEAPDQVFKVILRNVVGGAHLGIDYDHPSEWSPYRAALLDLDKRRNELLDFVGTIVSIKDDGDPAVLMSKASLSVSEIGQTDNVDIWLNAAPLADVTVRLAVDAAALTLSSTTLTFTPTDWGMRQTIVVTAVANNHTQTLPKSSITMAVSSTDPHYQAPLRQSLAQTSGFTIGAKIYTQKPGVYDTGNDQHTFPWAESFGVMTSPRTSADIDAFSLDDDPAGVVLTPEAIRHLSASTVVPLNNVAVRRNGHKPVVAVSLASEPAGSVAVTFTTPSDDGIKVWPTSLTFTPANWDTTQSIEIEAIASSRSGIESGVYYTKVHATATSTVDSFYNQPSAPMATVFVARYPAAKVLLDSSVLKTRENDMNVSSLASYQIRLGSEPMHWEPQGSGTYKPVELLIQAKADTSLTLSSDAEVSRTPVGSTSTISVAANASVSSPTTRMVRVGILRFAIYPAIASSTGSHQVGGARLRVYRLNGGENGGLGGIRVGVAVAEGSLATDWDENWLRADCATDGNTGVACSLHNESVSTASLPLSALFPSPQSFINIHDATAGETTIQPTGSFDSISNSYTPAGGWIEIDVTVAVNSFLSKQFNLEQSQQAYVGDISFVLYTLAPTFFAYDEATEVAFASKENSDISLRPHLQILGSGRKNLAQSASASQSHPGNALAAIDGQHTSNLGVASTFAMSSIPYLYPWWQTDLGSLRLIDDIIVTLKRKVSAASLTSAQLPVVVWLMLSETSLANNNKGFQGFTTANTTAKFKKRFSVTGRSFSASEDDTIVLRWRVFGVQGNASFGDDHFQANYSATVEARYVLLQVEGENNIALNEVEVFQPALASTRLSLGGYMPSPSVVSKGRNQIGFVLGQPGEQIDDECNSSTAICRRELLFTSGDWWAPQTVRVSVVDDAVATGDRDILLTHTLQSAEPSFSGTSVCAGSAATDPCRPSLFNASGVKPLQVSDDDENVVLFSTSHVELEEGSAVYPNAPIFRRERRVFPASVRCSFDSAKVIHTASGQPSEAGTCASVFVDSTEPSTYRTCITDPSAATLSAGSAWIMAGFAERDINVTEIILTVPQMQGAKYIRLVSVWWSDALDINSSAPSSLLDISKSWNKLRSIDISMVSRGQQTIRTSDLGLASIKVLLVAFDSSYDDVTNCLVAPAVVIQARVAVPFPLTTRGDLTSVDSVAPNESGRSRMHQVGRTATLGVRLASEPVTNVTISVVTDPDNAPLTIYDAAASSTVSVQATLNGGVYESGEVVVFSKPTSLVFTPRNWNQVQELTFLAVDDNNYNANRSFSVSHFTTSTELAATVIPHQTFLNGELTRVFAVISPDLAYTQAPFVVATERQPMWPRYWSPQWISGRGTVDVAVIDDDLPGITISASSVTVSESATTPGNYSIALDSAPTGDVVVTISYDLDDSLLTVRPLRLTFSSTNWKIPQFVFITPAPNDIYDAGAPLTVNYDRLIAKTSPPLLKHKVTSTKDTVYDGLPVGGNERDRTLGYVRSQGVVAIVQDDDTGCPREYTCLNGGVCTNITYGESVGNSSASVCKCPATYGMRNCGADCMNERGCAFSRVEVRLRCRPGDAQAICGDVFYPSRLVSTIYRMLTTDDLKTSSGKTFPRLSLGPMAEVIYIVNATIASCVDTASATAVCLKVTLDLSKGTDSTSNPIVDKLQGFLESGSLQTQPIYAELMTATQQYPRNVGASIAVWIFIGFCAASLGGVATLFTVRHFKAKRFHVRPDMGTDGSPDHDVTAPLKGSSSQVRAQ